MTVPRSQLISSEHAGCYHLVSRCVRRAWLCGQDRISGRSFEHRRAWIEDRLLFLAGRFAVELYGYAVMSNHYHVVIRLDPKSVDNWPDELVATRWLELFPPQGRVDEANRYSLALAALLENSEKMAACRARLGSVSWMMKLLNESIARRANKEDGCTGRFWEGRFESHPLLDDAAWLAAMVYVDLNPLRANTCTDPVTGDFTSIRRRLTHALPHHVQIDRMPAIAAGEPTRALGAPIGLAAYCELLEWTAGRYYSKQFLNMLPPGAIRRHGGESPWRTLLGALTARGQRAIGCFSALHGHAKARGRKWVKGWRAARRAEVR